MRDQAAPLEVVEEVGVELAAQALERAQDSDCELTLPVDLVLGREFSAETERQDLDAVEVPAGWMGGLAWPGLALFPVLILRPMRRGFCCSQRMC